MADKIGFKSYCWSVGTTSYRTDQFNLNMEWQLALMEEFRSLPENRNQTWKKNPEFQGKYYYFLKEKEFVKGSAKRPDKDAREKTSGLVDIGLLDGERNLTETGRALLKIAQSGDFKSDNLLEIPRDSYLYFKQLLKTCNDVDGKKARPFVVFLSVIAKTGYLTNEEFTYLLPLCTSRETTEKIVDRIFESRRSGLGYDEVLLSVLMDMDNYQRALELMQSETVTEELMCIVGLNRKSAGYDKAYYELYRGLEGIVFDGSEDILGFYQATRKLTNSKVGTAWRKYFFNTASQKELSKKKRDALREELPILEAGDRAAFNEEFFRLMHLFKAKATLSDYFDLNRRYFKMTDLVLFEDGGVKLDVLPRCYVEEIGEKLLEFAFTDTKLLGRDVALEEIAPCLELKAEPLYERLGRLLGREVSTLESARAAVREERYARFHALLDEKFSKENLLKLLDDFETRRDEEIFRMVTDNADIPTIFEYVLGIVWYCFSGRKGDVLEYMNLSLEADLLPRTHAGGGEADLVWEYEADGAYPAHTLLIEATLAEGSNQRRMEMEPVSRHLGEYRLTHPQKEAYCVFATTYLHPNVIADFRGRRQVEYYDSAGQSYISGMKIIPLQVSELKAAIRANMTYAQLYTLFKEGENSGKPAVLWYQEEIAGRIGTK